ncbi:UDP-N-acetylmuramoyl-tripeptide--D-alanyl-D-alanine ligase [Patescibacteria group bacterium]|nr:UDP-N-acetylmuramoyl-tripeptide--D-alanyl-D-alanine ligase [Patescibacteria group bacterium]
MIRDLLLFILKILAQATLWRYNPVIVGVTGSVGKTSSKEAIFAVLKNKFNVRRNQKNYNNEIGVPLTILGQETGGRSFLHWLKVFLAGFFGIFYTRKYPEVLVLEMGADRIGDIAYLVSFVHCRVGVITAIGEIPVHVEFFQGAGQVAQEKSTLIKSLDKDGWAVLNFDDERVKAMIAKTKAKIFGYGFSEEADLRVFNLEQHLENLEEAFISFKVDYRGSNVPIRLKKILGEHQICPILAAIAVGLTFKMNLVEISKALQDYRLPPGRLRLFGAIKNSWVIDDTYNSSPSSALAALEVLFKTKGRKIAALGDMLELGAFTEEAHRQVGAKAAKCVDLLLIVGERSIFVADQAEKEGMAEDKILHFASSEEAARILQDLMREGDVVLVKGSQSMRMEKIVKEIMAEPERAKELLVRQDKEWLEG